jgi:pimeloyl-ACP methyl ester carboxylesterase
MSASDPLHVRSADGTAIAFDRTGDGPPLILVGGALSDRSAAGALAGILSGTFTVVAYDRRGRGDSGDTPPYAVGREVDDLAALIAAVGGPALVYGHSSGAALAIDGVLGGLPIEKLALYEPPFIVDDSRPPLPLGYVEHIEALVTEGRRGEAVAYFMTTGVGLPAEIVEQMHDAPMWPGMEALAHTLSYDGRIMGGQMSGDPLPAVWRTAVTVPTLVMDGADSPEWQRASVAALAALLPHARRRSLQGQGHGADPAVLAPELVSFFLG